jgi:hypothetical protein
MSENTTNARFSGRWTLTTEEWKAELEQEGIGRSGAICVPVNIELHTLGVKNLRTSHALLCSLDRARQCNLTHLVTNG